MNREEQYHQLKMLFEIPEETIQLYYALKYTTRYDFNVEDGDILILAKNKKEAIELFKNITENISEHAYINKTKLTIHINNHDIYFKTIDWVKNGIDGRRFKKIIFK